MNVILLPLETAVKKPVGSFMSQEVARHLGWRPAVRLPPLPRRGSRSGPSNMRTATPDDRRRQSPPVRRATSLDTLTACHPGAHLYSGFVTAAPTTFISAPAAPCSAADTPRRYHAIRRGRRSR